MIEETTGQCETESAVPVGEIRITASKSMSIKHSAREDEVTNSMSPLRNPYKTQRTVLRAKHQWKLRRKTSLTVWISVDRLKVTFATWVFKTT